MRTAGSDYAAPLTVAQRLLLRDSRQAAGLTQAELAGLLAVGDQHISDVELGRREPSRDLLTRWCATLGLACEVRVVAKIRRER